MLACGLPVSALAALLGGIDFAALACLFAVSAAIAVFGCSLALAISVRASKTHDVMITVAGLWIVWLVSLPIWSGMSTIRGVVPPPDWFKKANPFVLVYAPYAWPGYVSLADVAIFVAALLLISTALLVVTIATIRRACSNRPGASGGFRSSTGSASRGGWHGCQDPRSTAIPYSGVNGVGAGRRDWRESCG